MLNLAFKLELVVLPIHLPSYFVDAVALGNFCEKSVMRSTWTAMEGMVTIVLLTPVTEKSQTKQLFYADLCMLAVN